MAAQGFKIAFRTPLAYNDLSSGYSPDPRQEDTPGDIRVELDSTGFKKYRFVTLASASGSLVAGDIAVYTDLAKLVADSRIAQAKKNFLVGVAQNTLTAGNRGWLQIGGALSVNTAANSVSKGDTVIHSGVDKAGSAVADGTASTQLPVGRALANSGGGFTNTMLEIPE